MHEDQLHLDDNDATARFAKGGLIKQFEHGRVPQLPRRRFAVHCPTISHAINRRPFVSVEYSRNDRSDDESELNLASLSPTGTRSSTASPSPSLPGTGYQVVRSSHGIDVLCLASLTSIHLGQGAKLDLSNFDNLSSWMRMKEASYLDWLPQYYEASPLIRTITDYLLMRMRRIMLGTGSQDSEMEVRTLYMKALAAMRAAIADDERRLDSDVLMASALLQLCELFRDLPSWSWSSHTAGLMKLLRMKGPDKLNAMEIAIVRYQRSVFTIEALRHHVEFLFELPEWIDLFASEMAPRSRDLLQATAFCVQGFRIMRAFLSKAARDSSLEAHIFRIVKRVHHHLQEEPDVNMDVECIGAEDIREWAVRMIAHRFLVVLHPLSEQSAVLEAQAQGMAKALLKWNAWKILHGGRMYHPTFAVYVAKSTRASAAVWSAALRGEPKYLDTKGTLRAKVFDEWREALLGPGTVKCTHFMNSAAAR